MTAPNKLYLSVVIVGGISAAAAVLVSLVRVDSPALGFSSERAPAARVNHVSIARETYNQALVSLASDKRNPLSSDDEAFVLERLIEEELLVQRGVELGLSEASAAVRSAIVKEVIEQVISTSARNIPDHQELRIFFNNNREFFQMPARLRLRHAFFPLGESREQTQKMAQQACEQIENGDDFDEVVDRYDIAAMEIVPNALLPLAKLREYVGPTVAAAAIRLQEGQVSQPVEANMGYHLVLVVERQDRKTVDFYQMEDQVTAEFVRRRDDEALRDYLTWLKGRARITRALPQDS